MEKFTADNFKKGFLVDEELMAGITESPDAPGLYSAYVVRHTTGETLGNQQFSDVGCVCLLYFDCCVPRILR